MSNRLFAAMVVPLALALGTHDIPNLAAALVNCSYDRWGDKQQTQSAGWRVPDSIAAVALLFPEYAAADKTNMSLIADSVAAFHWRRTPSPADMARKRVLIHTLFTTTLHVPPRGHAFCRQW